MISEQMEGQDNLTQMNEERDMTYVVRCAR